ncbi:MAG TPA: SBBP repeat-containing protein [Blastocatellia bacterium]|nr:SBBP repeat-containing protein [Blastocatellia bacterium]
MRLKPAGINLSATMEPINKLPAKNNYFIGSNPESWSIDVPTYAGVRYRNLYPGIDLVYYGNQQQLEYDFIVAPGVDPGVIKLAFDGVEAIHIDHEGNLILSTESGPISQRKPVVYQQANGVRRSVDCRYVVKNDREVCFEVAEFDSKEPLVIDPVLDYSSYLAGDPAEAAFGIAVDSAGNAYVVGVTASIRFPTTPGALQPDKPDRDKEFGLDTFVSKLNPEGTGLIYSTYLGGADFDDLALAVAVDSAGSAYVTGFTQSIDFPVTDRAVKKRAVADTEAFVSKLNAAGNALIYSTYLGGNRSQENSLFNIGASIALDGEGNAYVVGDTNSVDLPVPAGAVQAEFSGASDCFVIKLNSNGSRLIYARYLGGQSDEISSDIAVDSTGNAYVTGSTLSSDFPTTPGAFQSASGDVDGFVAKIGETGAQLSYSTYLGGSNADQCAAISVDQEGNAYVTGVTNSPADFPTTPGASQTTGGFLTDAFVTKLNAGGTDLIYSTFVGGSGNEVGLSIATDSLGVAYVAGGTTSNAFPITTDALQATKNGAAALKSTDGGNTWRPVSKGLVSKGQRGIEITSIAIDPSSPSTLYAATGGDGILKSTDGGNTWGDVSSTPHRNFIFFVIAVDPSTPSTVFAASSGFILKSTDSGSTWSELKDGLSNSFIFSLAFDVEKPGTIYAVSDSVYKSTNGGTSWATTNAGLTGSAFTAVAIDPQSSDTVYAAASKGGVFKSIDGGSSWAAFNSGLIDTDVRGLIVDPVTPSTLYAGTFAAGVFKSTNGGLTWNSANDGLLVRTVNRMAIDPGNPSVLYAATRFLGLFKSTDGGGSWGVANAGLTSDRVRAIAVDPVDHSTVYLGADSTNEDGFVAKLNAQGNELVYSTYFGGAANDRILGIAVDASGDIYITGTTSSTDLTVTPGAFQTEAGASLTRNTAFVSKIGGLRIPRITQASVEGKRLFITGGDFDGGAVVSINGQDQKTKNDGRAPGIKLICKKAGKQIAPGDTVILRVRNPDGRLSGEFIFTRPAGAATTARAGRY